MSPGHESKNNHSIGNREDNKSNRNDNIKSSSNVRTLYFSLIDLINWKIEQSKTNKHETQNNEGSFDSNFGLSDRRFPNIFPNDFLGLHDLIRKEV